MKKKIFIAAAVLISNQLLAQQDSAKLLNEVMVETATKSPVKQSQTGKVVTVISAAQIEKSSGKSVAQVLNEQAGITINGAYNAMGSVQTVFTRGASSGRTLILLDGIPVNDPSTITTEFDLNLFSINDVERIEICRGAQSTLYGSDAIAGVINIITVKKDVSKPFNVKLTAAFGNKNTARANLQLYGKEKKFSYSLRYAKLTTKGFSSAYDSTGAKGFDNDGYHGDAVGATLQYQATKSLLAKAFVQYSKYKADVDAGGFADDKDYTINNSSLVGGLGLRYKKGIISVSGNYQYGELKRKYLNDSTDHPGFTTFEDNKYNGRTQYGEVFANVTAAKWLMILAGWDYRWGNMNQQYYSLSGFGPYAASFPDTSLHQSSFYSSLIFNTPDKKLNVEIGGRINNHSKYGSNSTYTFNPSYSINDRWRVFGSIASGFKAPSIFQLLDLYSGNPNLEPERSTNYEFGVQQNQAKFGGRILYFHRDIKNGIDYDYINYTYYNFVKQQANGFEVELTAHPVEKLNISANYSLLTGHEQTQSRKSTNDTTYEYFLRRPKHNINLYVGYLFTKEFFVSLSAKSVSSRNDVGGYQANDVALNSYFLLGAYAEYKNKGHLKFFADLQNITNKKFFDLRGYNTIPFLVSAGATFNW